MISICVNYYNPKADARIRAMVTFTLECLAAYTVSEHEIILCDGSDSPSPTERTMCEQRGWRYLNFGKRLAFAVNYNLAAREARGDYIVWMASDIFVCADWDTRLLAETRRTKAWLAAPYLTTADYRPQTRNWVLSMRTFRPSAMTFNLNLITRECVERVGLMDEQFSGNFNDIDYLIRVRRAGGEAIIADIGQILHVSRGTSSTISNFDYEGDREKFIRKYPDLASKHAMMDIDVCAPIFHESRVYRWLLTMAYRLPRFILPRVMAVLGRIEPFFG